MPEKILRRLPFECKSPIPTSANVLDAALPFHPSCCIASITGFPFPETEEFANEFATVHLCTAKIYCLHSLALHEFRYWHNPPFAQVPQIKFHVLLEHFSPNTNLQNRTKKKQVGATSEQEETRDERQREKRTDWLHNWFEWQADGCPHWSCGCPTICILAVHCRRRLAQRCSHMLQRPHHRDRHLQQRSRKMRRPRNKERQHRAGGVMTLALTLLKPLASHTQCTVFVGVEGPFMYWFVRVFRDATHQTQKG